MTAISDADVDYLRRLLRRHSANRLEDGKEYLITARLGPIATSAGLASVPELLAAVRAGDHALRTEVVEAMTINETSFFRDVHPFQALRQHIVPELLGSRPRALDFWCAAAATGQEPYSLAMMMADDFPAVPAPRILATDLNRKVLAKAAAGRYSQLEVNRGLPAKALVQHFSQHGRDWVLGGRIRHMVTFRELNLAEPWPHLGPFDLILLRNVLIYFDDATRADVVTRAVRLLRPGGYLMMGSAETALTTTTAAVRVTVGRTLCLRAPARGTGTDAGVR